MVYDKVCHKVHILPQRLDIGPIPKARIDLSMIYGIEASINTMN